MSTLHTVNKSPFSHTTWASCLCVCQPGDALLLIEDGVYAALASSPQAEQLQQAHKAGVRLYALEPDLGARGLSGQHVAAIELVDYNCLVRTRPKTHSTQSWTSTDT